MRRKGIFTILAALFMVLAFSAMALAADQAFIKTTVPNIPKSTCYQAGTDTMEWDTLTTIAEGDVITFTLNNKVTVCKALDYFVTFANTAGVLDLTGNLPVSTTAGAITAAGAGLQWGFLVQAPFGSQIITLTLRKVITATGVLNALTPANRVTFTGTALTDKLIIKLFDGKGVGSFPTSGIQKYNATTVAYDTAIVATDNVLCIDTLTQDYLGEYVVNTPNSVPGLVGDKLNFSGDYTIAHIMAAQTFSLVTCKGATCGNIALGTSGQASTCLAFDYETIGTGLNGYCTTHTATAGYLPKFIIQSSQAWDLVPYTVSAEILVNGVAGEKGVYWSNTAPLYGRSATTTCGGAVGALALGAVSYLRGDGLTAAVPVAPIAGNCAGVAAAAKAVKFNTAAASLFLAGDFFFELNLPPFNYNLAEVNAGDVVTVRVTISKATCGTVTLDLCIGTFGCPASSTTGKCLVPFVSSLAAGDTYWNGLAIINTGSTAGSVTLNAYKKDGTTATATVAVPALGTFSGMVDAITWTGTKPAGVPAYIELISNYPSANLDAFVMMADGTHNSMGYTCRKPAAVIGSY